MTMTPSNPRRRVLAIFVATAMLVGACSDGDSTTDEADSPTTPLTAAEDDTDQDDTDNTIGSRGDGETTDDSETDVEADVTVPADPQAPRVVAFEQGASATVMSDSVVRGNRHTYTIAAGKGQTMELLITSLEDNAVFDLIGPSGAVIEQEQTNTTTVLPADGVYRVVVGGTRGNASYELTIVIPPGTTQIDDTEDPAGSDGVAEPIRFESGTSGATVSGSVQDAKVKLYTIDVSAGQTMTFSLTSIQNNGQIAVVAPSGELIMSDATLEEFVLSEDGEYTLIVSATEGQAVYELTVTVV